MVAPTSFSDGLGKAPVAPWAVHILRSTKTQIAGLNIFNELRDGLDIDGSDHVAVEGGFVQAHDDALSIKSTNYGSGSGAQGRPVKDVTFSNIMVMNTGAGSALGIGTELHASEIARISYRNIDILHALGAHSTAISIRNGDRADVHDIIYDNVRIEDRPGTLLHISIETDGYLPDSGRGSINNIAFRDLRIAQGASGPSQIAGMNSQHTVSGVRFENFRRGNDSQIGQVFKIDIENAPDPQWSQSHGLLGKP